MTDNNLKNVGCPDSNCEICKASRLLMLENAKLSFESMITIIRSTGSPYQAYFTICMLKEYVERIEISLGGHDEYETNARRLMLEHIREDVHAHFEISEAKAKEEISKIEKADAQKSAN